MKAKRINLALAVALLCAAKAVAQTATHTVGKGEMLFPIAQKYGVTTDAIAKRNPNATSVLFPGMALFIPTTAQQGIGTNQGAVENPVAQQQQTSPEPQQAENAYNSVLNNDNDDTEHPQGGLEFVYQAIDNTNFAMGYDVLFGNFSVNFVVANPDLPSGYTGEFYRIGAGLNQRYWYDKAFVEVGIGVEYTYSKVESGYGSNKIKVKSDYEGLYFTPRIGVKLFQLWKMEWGIVAGYRWDFNKFKFKKEYTDDYFTIGLALFPLN